MELFTKLSATDKKKFKEKLKSVENFGKSKEKNDTLVKVLNASNRLSLAENLVNNSTCASSYNLNKFKIIKVLVMFSI